MTAQNKTDRHARALASLHAAHGQSARVVRPQPITVGFPGSRRLMLELNRS